MAPVQRIRSDGLDRCSKGASLLSVFARAQIFGGLSGVLSLRALAALSFCVAAVAGSSDLWQPRAAAKATDTATAQSGTKCAEGCEKMGNCNRALGLCECPVGFQGPACEQLTWPSCRVHPTARALYCGSAPIKSCSCQRECEAFHCPNGECEIHIEASAACFERAPGRSVVVDGVTWGGGSAIPEADDEGVKYYAGHRHEPYSDESLISRDEALLLQRGSDSDGRRALPLSHCPDMCSWQGACVQASPGGPGACLCHWGFAGPTCADVDLDSHLHICYNLCSGRGRCLRGFCHCDEGYWGKDCSSSQVFTSGLPAVHKMLVYVYDLPWHLAYQPEKEVGWRNVDFIYTSYQLFAERLLQDGTARTENPWEANMFYIPSMTRAYTNNHGMTVTHNRRVVEWVRHTWPFFNRSQGLDHFIWLPADQGACYWPGDSDPPMANLIKLVHYGWHFVGADIPAYEQPPLPNKRWGCFHPTRDIAAAPYWHKQQDEAASTYGLHGSNATFEPDAVPPRLLFLAGGMRHDQPGYSHGVRQALHKLFGAGQHPNVSIVEGYIPDYLGQIRATKYCLAPSGHGWGIRLPQYMVLGCVPVIIQDGIFQFYEDQLPYSEFSLRLSQSQIPDIVALLEAVPLEEYLRLRRGVARHWQAFVWSPDVGGKAYEYTVQSLRARWRSFSARQYYGADESASQAAERLS